MTTLQDFFNENVKLPTPPAIAFQIVKAVRQDEDFFNKLAEIIKTGPALTARVLKISNSSFYGLIKRVDSLTQAISLIGTQTLKNIALSFVIVEAF